jgi:hypothetical protein
MVAFRQRGSGLARDSRDNNRILGLLLVLLLVGVTLLVARSLHHSNEVEDCMMQGRTDCNGVIAMP